MQDPAQTPPNNHPFPSPGCKHGRVAVVLARVWWRNWVFLKVIYRVHISWGFFI